MPMTRDDLIGLRAKLEVGLDELADELTAHWRLKERHNAAKRAMQAMLDPENQPHQFLGMDPEKVIGLYL